MRRTKYGIPTTLLVLFIVITIIIHRSPYWIDIGVMSGIYAMIALSIGLCYGQAGILSVAQATFASLGAYATAILDIKLGAPPLVGLIAALTIPAITGYLLCRLLVKMSGLTLAIATLIFGEVIVRILKSGGDFTGGYIGLSGIAPLPFGLGGFGAYLLVWGVLFGLLIGYHNVVRSAYGLSLRTIKSDPLRSQADGINVSSRLSVVFALSAVIAGLAGWFYAHYMVYVDPDSLGPTLSIETLLMAIIGGASFIAGPLVGAVVLTVLTALIPGGEATGMIFGAVLMTVLILFPDGICGLLNKVTRSRGGAVSESAVDAGRAPHESASTRP